MNSLLYRFKGKVDHASSSFSQLSLGRNEKDKNENDTILSRAMLRYYGTSVPAWLAPAEPITQASAANQIKQQYRPAESQRPTRPSRAALDFMYQDKPAAEARPAQAPVHGTAQAPVPSTAQAQAQAHGGDDGPRQRRADRQRLGEKLRRANW